MISNKLFTGGGGGGGGGSDFTNTPDNLRSEDTFEGLMGMCVGPIKGPVDGLKGVKIDGTAVINETGQVNFPEFTAIYSTGDPTLHPQLVNMRLGSAAAPMAVGVALSNSNTAEGTGSPGDWVSRTLANVGPNYLDLRFIAQQLFRQDEGGIYSTTATIEIQMKPSGLTTWINPTLGDAGAWTGTNPGKTGGGIWGLFPDHVIDQTTGNEKNFKIKGKTTSPTVVEVRIWVPDEGAYEDVTWDVRARLLEREAYSNDDDIEQRQISWESISAIYNDVIGDEEDWRGLSWLQLYGKATDNLKGVPEVEVVADTKVVQVPGAAIFNPSTRVYTPGIWDGTWSSAYTNDPAWIINDAISDELSGLAQFAPGSHLNKWDALEASKWFSEMVPDGAGGEHPRYSLNVVHNQPMKAEEFIRYLAGAVGALTWDDGSGEWRMKVDKPETPVDIFTLENIEGEFSYSHTDVDTRYNDYRGTYLNEEFDFREETIGVVDNTSISLIGHKPTTLALIGCTNRQEALRRLKLRLRSSVNETHIVNFTTNRRADHLVPLDVILVADADLGDQDAKTTGRVISMNATRDEIEIRDPLRLEVGVDYQLRFAKLNASYEPDTPDEPSDELWKHATVVDTRIITNTAGQRGNVTTLYLDTPLPADAAEYLVVALEATGLTTLPKQYRILSLSKDDEENERVTISAVEIDTGKWDAADAVTSQDSVYQDLRTVAPPPLPPIGGGDIITLETTPSAQGSNHTIIGNWTRPPGALVDGFRVFFTVNGGPQQLLAQRLLLPTFDMVNPPHGLYEFRIHTITRTGVLSTPLVESVLINQATLAAGDISYGDGTPIEDLKPDQPGATRNIWRGEWATDTAYVVGDMFTFEGDSYIVDVAHTSAGVEPDPTKVSSFVEAGITADLKFKRSNTTPSTPTGNNPIDWSDGVPAGTEALWLIRGNKKYGILLGVWSTPQQINGLVFRGAYDAGTAYLANQTVTFGGGTYIAINDTTGNAPSGTAEANAYWDVLAAPGAPGTPADPPAAFNATINLTSGAAVNLRTAADAAGYTGASDATITFKVPNGVVCRGLSSSGKGIDSGLWPTGDHTIAIGLVVESGGIVDGGGGKGGAGGGDGFGNQGDPGGDAIYVRVPMTGGITINSGGTVRAGGGGGGGGGAYVTFPGGEPVSRGGSGGGGGAPNGAGGAAGVGSIANGNSGNPGTTAGGGTGGAAVGSAGAGGNGSTFGSTNGTSGATATYTGGAEGIPGYAVRKNGNTVTVTNNGTMTGTAG